jgi:hypothetical protein
VDVALGGSVPSTDRPANWQSGVIKARPHGIDASARRELDEMSAQNDLIGAPWRLIDEEPSAAPNGGSRAKW